MPPITAINNDDDLDAALERIGELLRSPEDSPEEAELLALSALVEAYEAIHYPISDPTPAGVVQGRLDALGLEEDCLIPCIGSREMVAEVLADQRPITPAMAEALSQLLGIDVGELLQEPAARQG